jgi:FkbM family methyltransferase
MSLSSIAHKSQASWNETRLGRLLPLPRVLPVLLRRGVRLLSLTNDPLAFLCAQYKPTGLYGVHVRELNARVILRGGTTDARVLWDTVFRRYHIPGSMPKSILDLGANIGITAAHFAVLYPRARIVAVEMDADSAALARINTQQWRDRITVINAAVWTNGGTVRYELTPGDEYGAQVTCEGGRVVQAIAIAELAAQGFDYVKMDVEGAERQLLEEGEWTQHVRELKVEVHAPYTTRELAASLQRSGFRTTVTRDGHHVAATKALLQRRGLVGPSAQGRCEREAE